MAVSVSGLIWVWLLAVSAFGCWWVVRARRTARIGPRLWVAAVTAAAVATTMLIAYHARRRRARRPAGAGWSSPDVGGHRPVRDDHRTRTGVGVPTVPAGWPGTRGRRGRHHPAISGARLSTGDRPGGSAVDQPATGSGSSGSPNYCTKPTPDRCSTTQVWGHQPGPVCGSSRLTGIERLLVAVRDRSVVAVRDDVTVVISAEHIW
jgi:hypothetical protein